jgi:hypothetical protein
MPPFLIEEGIRSGGCRVAISHCDRMDEGVFRKPRDPDLKDQAEVRYLDGSIDVIRNKEAHVGNSVGAADGRGRAVGLCAPNPWSHKAFRRASRLTPATTVQATTIFPT